MTSRGQAGNINKQQQQWKKEEKNCSKSILPFFLPFRNSNGKFYGGLYQELFSIRGLTTKGVRFKEGEGKDQNSYAEAFPHQWFSKQFSPVKRNNVEAVSVCILPRNRLPMIFRLFGLRSNSHFFCCCRRFAYIKTVFTFTPSTSFVYSLITFFCVFASKWCLINIFFLYSKRVCLAGWMGKNIHA